MADQVDVSTAGAATASFILAQICLASLLKNGLLPKAEAEERLRGAIEANKAPGNGPGNLFAASLLESVLKQVSEAPGPTRQ